MTPEQEMAYIAAFIDGEGWIVFIPGKNNNKLTWQIGFTNTNQPLIEAVTAMACRADLIFNVVRVSHKNPKHSDRWNGLLVGGRQAVERFSRLIPIVHPGKIQRLHNILQHYVHLDNQGRQRSEPVYNVDYIARRSEISRLANAQRWKGHIAKKPRQRPQTEAQKERRNLLGRQRRLRRRI